MIQGKQAGGTGGLSNLAALLGLSLSVNLERVTSTTSDKETTYIVTAEQRLANVMAYVS